MNIFTRFLRDEHGFVLSAESVLLGTVGVVGATVGLGAVAESVNDELTDVAMAVRSLDQSYKVEGRSRCGAWVAGSQFTQTPVEQSLKELAAEIDDAKAKIKADDDDDREEMKKDKDGDPPPPKKTKPGKNKKKDKDQDEDDSV
jgi:hypothetical protein